ncbi:SAF domain-containing protein [Dietzia cercidiphylli]|uniref:SAF domain-containing protein n=1 Tax=Dietzia cercidiphylli TaxID=498199 RepID=UPI00223AE82E|nr:SAF domain-containing protein [Dietzia cercidiphylli]MCT1516513.1 SAF domain-containing protein [Dietzia cercidiphylli]
MALGKKTPATKAEPEQAPAAGQTPVRNRRRPLLLAAGALLAVLSILGVVYLFVQSRETVEALVLKADTPAGATLTADMLTKRTLNADSGLEIIPVEDADTILDSQLATRLPAGSLLTPSHVTVQLLPEKGTSIVGVAVPYQRLPATPLQRGDKVRVVDTPRDQAEPPSQGPVATRGTVVSTEDHPDTGVTVIDLIVPDGEASWVAARAATNRIAVIIDSRGR